MLGLAYEKSIFSFGIKGNSSNSLSIFTGTKSVKTSIKYYRSLVSGRGTPMKSKT